MTVQTLTGLPQTCKHQLQLSAAHAAALSSLARIATESLRDRDVSGGTNPNWVAVAPVVQDYVLKASGRLELLDRTLHIEVKLLRPANPELPAKVDDRQ